MFMNSSDDYVIRTKGLSKTFGSVQALQSLDLAVPRNSIVGFLGPNGAGKTTTIRLLLGLNRPTSGSGTIFGLDILKENEEIRRRTGYLAQNPRFYEDLTAREILRFTARFFYTGPKERVEARIAEVLDLVGLSEKADRTVKGFSGGERQRLGIAQAQINEPELLILDEPAAALDPMGRRDVLQIMEKLRNRATIFYSTHILADVQKVSDQVVILDKGRLVTQGPVETLLSNRDGLVYTLLLQGDLSRVQEQVRRQPWVSDLSVRQVNGSMLWRVCVNDDQAARSMLLRMVLAEKEVVVLEFGREKVGLEDVFMQLVQRA